MPEQIGPYRIVRPLGQGGMGAVYEALQEPIARKVAVKLLLPQHAQNADILRRFLDEARAVNLVAHPGLVQVSDYGQAADGTAYLVMEYLVGETLSARLTQRCKPGQGLPPAESLQVAFQIADALAAAHDKSVVHRDLKPANIMLVPDSAVHGGERAKVLDFGIAKLVQGQSAGTITGLIMGTPRYMSPEQCRGLSGVDDKTDVFALGVILYEMLAGEGPFVAEGELDYLVQHATQDPRPLDALVRGLPHELIKLVQSLLIRDKDRRPPMREVAAQLSRLLASERTGVVVAAVRPDLAAGVEYPETPPTVMGPSSQSTLGGSIGQPLPRERTRPAGRAAFVAVMGAGLLGSFFAMRHGLNRPASRASTAPAMASPMKGPEAAAPSLGSPSALPIPESDPQPAADAPAPIVRPSEDARPSSPGQVNWTVTTIPAGATVIGPDDAVLGLTPLTITCDSGNGTQTLRIRRPDFFDQKVEVDCAHDSKRSIRLTPRSPKTTLPDKPSHRGRMLEYED